jgi:hypothetical protein
MATLILSGKTSPEGAMKGFASKVNNLVVSHERPIAIHFVVLLAVIAILWLTAAASVRGV